MLQAKASSRTQARLHRHRRANMIPSSANAESTVGCGMPNRDRRSS